MELHLFIFLATKSGPASFQPFSHPSPAHGVPQTGPAVASANGRPRALLQMLRRSARNENTKEWSTNQCSQIEMTFRPFHCSFSWPGYRRRLLAKTGRVGAPRLLLPYLISDSLILCNLWHMAGLQKETKWNQRKYGRRRKWSHWFPPLQ